MRFANTVRRQDTSVTTLERGGETGDIIAEDIDEDIAKFRPDFFPIDTIARKAAKKKRKTNYVVKHYNIDASRITCITNAEHTESASKKRVALPIDAADGSVFNVYDTINVRGVDGYASDGSTVTPGVDLMLYVVALDASSGLPVVVAINGKKQNPADVECYVLLFRRARPCIVWPRPAAKASCSVLRPIRRLRLAKSICSGRCPTPSLPNILRM